MAAHVPRRTCVGCRRVRDRPELVRLARGESGHGTLDVDNQLPGRGAYLCADGPDCLAQARRRRALGRALRIGEEVVDYQTLSAALAVLQEETKPSPR